MGVRHGAHQNLTEPKRVLRGSTRHAHHNHHPGPGPAWWAHAASGAQPGHRSVWHRVAVMVATGAAIGGGKPTPFEAGEMIWDDLSRMQKFQMPIIYQGKCKAAQRRQAAG
jgi:hypothetical protein